MSNKEYRWALFGILLVFAACIVGGIIGAVTAPAASVGPNPVVGTIATSQQGYIPTAAGSLTCSSTGGWFYLSSGTTTATSIPCNQVVLSVSTSQAYLGVGGGTATTVVLPVGTVVTLYPSNLNQLIVSGSGAKVGYIYSN